MKTLNVLTIGYEGACLGDFLSTLKHAKVTLLLDVREIALSRRKGFSKSALSAALSSSGIDYRHERALGSPKAIRHQLRADGNLQCFFRDFRQYLASQRTLLDALAAELRGSVALLCYERHATECHRSVVAQALASRAKTTVHHLEVTLHGSTHPASNADSRQSLPAAE
jgi:uncharacterized protein (DUF488 family)